MNSPAQAATSTPGTLRGPSSTKVTKSMSFAGKQARGQGLFDHIARQSGVLADDRAARAHSIATEHRGATWSAQPPGTLTPGLGHEGESSLDRAQVVALLVDHLRTAPVAWDPFPGEPGADID